MNPMCGPSFGLVIALRAFSGDPSFVSTSSTSPFGSSWWSIFAISWIRRDASVRETPGEKRTYTRSIDSSISGKNVLGRCVAARAAPAVSSTDAAMIQTRI